MNSVKKTGMVLSLVNVALFVVMITMNTLAVILPLNGKGTGELSDSYPNLFVPAGVTFSIWSVIYTLLLIFVTAQIIAAARGSERALNTRTAVAAGLNFTLNALWIVTWHYQLMALSVLVMVLLLGTLIYLFLATQKMPAGALTALTVKVPVNVYLGWIAVATIANITAWLVTLGWNGFGLSQSFWTVLVISVACALAVVMMLRHKVISYALVAAWAITGIIIKRTAQPVVYNEIVIACCAALAVIAVVLVLTVVRKVRKAA